MGRNRKYNDVELENAVRNNTCLRHVARTLGLTSSGYNNSLKSRIEEMNLDTTHWNSSVRVGTERRVYKLPLKKILVVQSTYSSTTLLKKRLFKEGYKKELCEKCGLGPVWNSLPLTLEMHHVNGNNKDNRIENLQILCPNCHSQR